MRSSVLTAFYTPPQVIDVVSSALRDSGLKIDKFLEPSAGIGSFIQSFSENQQASVTAYEKDLLTGKILKQLYPQSNIRISGFEEIPEKEQTAMMSLPVISLLAILRFSTFLIPEAATL